MNKEGFLKELRDHLRVLDEREQEDIIDEYAQHIDLKMKSGLSEEEAISDFGNIAELAAEILEAYHVDPKFEEKTKGIVIRTPDMEKVSEGSRKLAGKAAAFFRKNSGKDPENERYNSRKMESFFRKIQTEDGRQRRERRQTGEKEPVEEKYGDSGLEYVQASVSQLLRSDLESELDTCYLLSDGNGGCQSVCFWSPADSGVFRISASWGGDFLLWSSSFRGIPRTSDIRTSKKVQKKTGG